MTRTPDDVRIGVMPKIIGDTLADHRSLTRHRLFEALSDLLSEHPFDAITMSQIASRAKVGRTAVYNHFSDKESLLLAFMQQTTGQFAQLLRTALDGQDDPVEQLRIYLRAHLELKDRLHLAPGINLRAQISPANTVHLHEHAGIVEHVLQHILTGAMQAGRIPEQDPHVLVALIHSTLAGQALPTEAVAREDTVRTIQAFILRAIGVSPEESPLPAVSCASGRPETIHQRPDAQAFLRCPVSHM